MRCTLLFILAGLVNGCARPDPGDLPETPPPAAGSAFEAAWQRAGEAFGLSVLRGQRYVVLTDRPETAATCLERNESAMRFLETILDAGKGCSSRSGIIMVLDEARRAALGEQLGSGDLEGALAESFGFFSPASGFVHVKEVPDCLDRHLQSRVLIHECTHQMVRRLGFHLVRGSGAWINEGIALFLEAYSPETGTIKPSSCERWAQACEVERAGLLIPLARFLDAGRREFSRSGIVGVSYEFRGVRCHRLVPLGELQGAALMWFLHHEFPALFPALVRKGLRDGLDVGCLEGQIGVSARDVERRFHSWLRTGK